MKENKRSIIHLKVYHLKEIIEKSLNYENNENNESEVNDTLKKLDESIIELNEDDLLNLLLMCKSKKNKTSHQYPNINNDKKFGLITRKELAKELEISLPTLRKWTIKKIIPNHIKLGGFIYYNKQDVINFLKEKNKKKGE